MDAANVNLLNYRLKLIRDHSELARSKAEEQTGTPDQLTRSAVRSLLPQTHSIAVCLSKELLEMILGGGDMDWIGGHMRLCIIEDAATTFAGAHTHQSPQAALGTACGALAASLLGAQATLSASLRSHLLLSKLVCPRSHLLPQVTHVSDLRFAGMGEAVDRMMVLSRLACRNPLLHLAGAHLVILSFDRLCMKNGAIGKDACQHNAFQSNACRLYAMKSLHHGCS